MGIKKKVLAIMLAGSIAGTALGTGIAFIPSNTGIVAEAATANYISQYQNRLYDIFYNPEDYVALWDFDPDPGAQFALADINEDGVPELLVSFSNTYIAAMHTRVYTINKNTNSTELYCNKLFHLFSEFYKGGTVKETEHHNMFNSSFMPYTVSKYDKASNSYLKIFGDIHAYDKKLSPYNYESSDDKDNDGIVYYMTDTKNQEHAYTKAQYNAFVNKYMPASKKINMSWQKLTYNNIKNLPTYALKCERLGCTVSNYASGMTVKWNKVAGAQGYKIYRKIDNGNFKCIKTVGANTTSLSNYISDTFNGHKITYAVRAYNGSTLSGYTASSYYRVSTPKINYIANKYSKTASVRWGRNTKATGYFVRYYTGSTAKTIKLAGNAKYFRHIQNLTKGKTYSVYVRSYKIVSGKTYYSAWSPYKAVKIAK